MVATLEYRAGKTLREAPPGICLVQGTCDAMRCPIAASHAAQASSSLEILPESFNFARVLPARSIETEFEFSRCVAVGAGQAARNRVYSQVWGRGTCDTATPSLKRLLPLEAEEHLQRDRDFHDPLEEAHKRPPFVNFKR